MPVKNKKEKVKPVPVVENEISVSIGGNHPELTRFKGLVKMQGKKIGEELIPILKRYNDDAAKKMG